MAKIQLENMAFYAHHGCFDQEQQIGTYFTVTLTVEPETCRATLTDNIDEAIDYSLLYTIVAQQMEQPSHLLEHVAGRIIRAVKTRYPELKHIELKISKLAPPIGGQVDRATVCLTEADI